MVKQPKHSTWTAAMRLHEGAKVSRKSPHPTLSRRPLPDPGEVKHKRGALFFDPLARSRERVRVRAKWSDQPTATAWMTV